MSPPRTIALRAIDLERLGVDIEFINTDNPERRADALANAHEIAATRDLYEALQLAVRQNSHDMLMTGEELRKCEAALAKARPTPGEGNG